MAPFIYLNAFWTFPPRFNKLEVFMACFGTLLQYLTGEGVSRVRFCFSY